MASCLRLLSPNAPRSSAIKLLSLRSSKWATRSLHRSRELPYDIEKGLGNFLPPPALQTLVEYQDGLLDRLNHELHTDPTQERHTSVAQIAIQYSLKQERTLAFNYAVLALNNSFFLDQLSPLEEGSSNTNHEGKISNQLYKQIEMNYGDLIHLKSTFSAAAMGIFSSGWVWLVSDGSGNLAVLPTVGPSTLLVRSRQNMHYEPSRPILGEDSGRHAMATTKPQLPNVFGGLGLSGNTTGNTTPRNRFDFQSRTLHTTPPVSIDSMERNNIHGNPTDQPIPVPIKFNNSAALGRVIFPLFCIPVYEHAWMSAGYGVWGKEAWLKEFWSVLDWKKVSDAYNKHITNPVQA